MVHRNKLISNIFVFNLTCVLEIIYCHVRSRNYDVMPGVSFDVTKLSGHVWTKSGDFEFYLIWANFLAF